MSAGCSGTHHPLRAAESGGGGLPAHPVVQPADSRVRRPFINQNSCQPCRQFSIGKPGIHVLAANRRHQMGSISAQEDPPFAEAGCHKALHTETAFPEPAHTSDIDAGAPQKFRTQISGRIFPDKTGVSYHIAPFPPRQRKRLDRAARGKEKTSLVSPPGSILVITQKIRVPLRRTLERNAKTRSDSALPAVASQNIPPGEAESCVSGAISADNDKAIFFRAIRYLMIAQKTNRRICHDSFFQELFRSVLRDR